MNDYTTLFDRFWKYNEEKPLGAGCTAFYFFLLNIWKEKGNDFTLSDRKICSVIRISRPIITSIKVKLQKHEFIRYQTANGIGTRYTILFRKPVVSKEKRRDKGLKKQKKVVVQKPKIRKQLPKDMVQPIQEITYNNQIRSPVLTIPEVIPIPNTEQENTSTLNKGIPMWDEFLEYAEKTEIYFTIYEDKLKAKYEEWITKGWKDNLGNPITDWKKKLRFIIPYFGKTGHSENFRAVASLKKNIKE